MLCVCFVICWHLTISRRVLDPSYFREVREVYRILLCMYNPSLSSLWKISVKHKSLTPPPLYPLKRIVVPSGKKCAIEIKFDFIRTHLAEFSEPLLVLRRASA